jgi:3-carboxy-cis,cis-muconate cycloisomerase
MAGVAATIIVHPDRMRENIEATRGAVCAERVMMLLAASAGRDEAHRLIGDAVDRSRDTGKMLSEVLRTTPEVARVLSNEQIDSVDKPEEYLGAAEAFRQQLLAAARQRAKE